MSISDIFKKLTWVHFINRNSLVNKHVKITEIIKYVIKLIKAEQLSV